MNRLWNVYLIVTLFIVFAFGTTSASANTGTINITSQGSPYHYHYIINDTKTTGGWPFLENDIYDTLGVAVLGNGNTDDDSWIVTVEAVCLSSSRAKGSTSDTNAIRSQTITVQGTPTDRYWWLGEIVGTDYLPEWSWPHGGSDLRTMSSYPNYQLMSAAIDARSDAPFRLNATVLNGSLTAGSDTKRSKTGEELRKEENEKTRSWEWVYAPWPWDGKSDSAASARWNVRIMPGDTFEFDVIDDTYWGLLDKSQARAHVRITVPASLSIYDRDNITVEMY